MTMNHQNPPIQILKDKELYVFDMDGTIYLGKIVFDFAIRFIENLRAAGKRVLFFTNNASRSTDVYLEKLTRLGFSPTASEIMYLFKVANLGKSKKGPISQALQNYGGKPLDGGWYWTCTEVGRNEVVNISDGGSVATEKKGEENSVRAIRAF
jgi:ribonucleotide monophosphatase NagD (HAD superfamily)